MNRRKLLCEVVLAVGLVGCGGLTQSGAPAGEPPTAPAASAANASSSTVIEPASAAPPGVDAGLATPSEGALSPAAPTADSAPGSHAAEATNNASKDKPSKSTTAAATAAKRPKSGPAESSATSAPAAHPSECGEKGQKPCPLQGWMKANMAAAAASGDANELAKQFDYVASHAPPGLANWSTIAKSGATKAKAGDIDGAKGACKSCHDQYKAKYKAELRDRAF